MVDVAQLVRASDCGSGGRGFESHHPPYSIPIKLSQNLLLHNKKHVITNL